MGPLNFEYQLTPQDLTDYQYAVKNRILKRSRSTDIWFRVWGTLLIMAMIGLGGIAAVMALPALTGHRFAPEEMFAGFFLGLTALFAATWLNYFHQRRSLVKPSGPTYSRHHAIVDERGLGISTDKIETSSRWSLFDEITVYKNIFVLWMEPGQGIVIPRSEFADEAAAQEFFSSVSAHIANAKLKG